jgi:hypothetical protein
MILEDTLQRDEPTVLAGPEREING